MYDTNFDRQKLSFHPRELAEWLDNGATRGPIYTEMELCRRCNCRCTFCGVDYQVNKSDDTIAVADAKRIISQLHQMGNKSIMFSGHGEPLLNPGAAEIVGLAASLMSTSVTTNGIALNEANLAMIDALEWIRFSINGCTPANYAAIHRTSPERFEQVLGNVARAVERKRRYRLKVVIGTQLVLLDENAELVVTLAERLKGIGVDYFSVKPYSQHPLCEHRLTVNYEQAGRIEEQLRALQSDEFNVIFRAGSLAKVGSAKPYQKCFGTHFLCFVSANGDVWECNVFAGDQRFLIGNALREPLMAIWSGPRRREVLEFIGQQMNLEQCRDICRMDECNRYLWRLKNPFPHDNFI